MKTGEANNAALTKGDNFGYIQSITLHYTTVIEQWDNTSVSPQLSYKLLFDILNKPWYQGRPERRLLSSRAGSSACR